MDAQWLGDLWSLVKTAGPFATALLLYLWWSEREERRSCQKSKEECLTASRTSNEALLERTLKGMNDADTTLRSIIEFLKAGRRSNE